MKGKEKREKGKWEEEVKDEHGRRTIEKKEEEEYDGEWEANEREK